MRKVLNMRRGNNLTMVFMVVHDDVKHTVEVWQINPTVNWPNVHCKTIPYGEDIRIPCSLAQAQRSCVSLASSLSKLTLVEWTAQAPNLRTYGEVR